MFSIMITSLILITIASTVMILASIMSKKALTDREKCSPFVADLTLNHHHDSHFHYDFF